MKIIKQDLYRFSTIRTKSFTDHFCSPSNLEDLKKALKYRTEKQLGLIIIGNGSNILFAKEHYKNYLFVKFSGDFNFFNLRQDGIEIGSAYSLKAAGKKLIKLGYEDYIFFNLIPASIGGAITQNAGVGPNEEIKDLCLSVKLFDTKYNKQITLSNKEFQFDYRDSIIKKNNGRYIVLSALFSDKNKVDDIESLLLKTKDRILEKSKREPIGYSFGSTFKNSSVPAWKCIKKVVSKISFNDNIFYSDKHSNWIINTNKGSGEDAHKIISETEELVKKQLDIDLKTEVRIIQ